MSKKRTSPESSTEEQTNSDSDAIFQQDDCVKRVKLTPLSDTKLQDLPAELIERILVRAVAMEVEEMHLAKSVWKEKAKLVMSRLSSVCPDWSNILTTKFFQNELYRTLVRTVKETIRLEIRDHMRLQDHFFEALTLKDELFFLGPGQAADGSDYAIHVYDRNNLAQVKDVIPLPGIKPEGVAACNVSNCLYILNIRVYDDVFLYRITKEDEHKFSISPFISRKWKPNALTVSDNGSLIVWKVNRNEHSTTIALYDANGSLQHKKKLTSDLYRIDKIIPKPNGNLVLVSTAAADDMDFRTKLTEIDMNGTVLRQYQSSLHAFGAACLADPHGRIVIVEAPTRFQFLDNEFNRLKVIVPKLVKNNFCIFKFNYNRETNELVTIIDVECRKVFILAIFHLTEE